MNTAFDGVLYEPDAIDVGILIFGRRTCSCCRSELPRNTDYFAPDKSNPAGLVYECRRCRRALERDRYASMRAEEVVSRGQLDLFAPAPA